MRWRWRRSPVLAIGVLHVAIAWLLRTKDRGAALHALAVAVGAVTIALALQLDGPWLTVALGIEGLAVIIVGLQLAQPWFRLGGFGLIIAAILRYIDLSLSATPTVFSLFRDQPFAVGAFSPASSTSPPGGIARSQRGPSRR